MHLSESARKPIHPITYMSREIQTLQHYIQHKIYQKTRQKE